MYQTALPDENQQKPMGKATRTASSMPDGREIEVKIDRETGTTSTRAGEPVMKIAVPGRPDEITG